MYKLSEELFFVRNNTNATEESHEDEMLYPIPSVNITMLDDNQRIIFFILYLIVFSLSIIGNIATLFTTYERKIRLVQKTLIISLALSDITVCIFIGVNNMINFSHPMTNWLLGEFMCSFIPYTQVVGSVANSITMVSIACDRYVNIIHPTTKQWNPNIWKCIVLLFLLWGVSGGVSFPMFTFTTLRPVLVYLTDEDKNVLATEPLHLYMCVTSTKPHQKTFYSIIFSIIFLPLTFSFLWFYYKIAKLIWRKRKPFVNKINDNNNSVTIETSTDSKTSGSKQSPIAIQVQRKMKNNIKNNRLHMERKIKTFKIILIIMTVFIICRMPYWIFRLIKFSTLLNERQHWVISNALSLLVVVNTSLNPFLYSFLNQTILYFDKFFISVGDFISNICCCCCSDTEFDDFEKDNPFCPQNYDPKPKQMTGIKPRGPYMDLNCNHNQNHVKFMNVAVIDMYPKETSSNTY